MSGARAGSDGQPARADVVVLGDGPAGSALAAALTGAAADVVLVGPGEPWAATYGGWFEDIPAQWQPAFHPTAVSAVGTRLHDLGPAYAMADNTELRRLMLHGVRHLTGWVDAIAHASDGCRVVLRGGAVVRGRVLVDARGAPPGTVTRQTAYGLVLDERPAAVAGEAAVLMDWRQPLPGHEPTFLYAMPLADGRWLVEETSLASASPPAVEDLRRRLAVRLGTDHTASSRRVELVSIPMSTSMHRNGDALAFGAAAGYVHPATGYSVVAAMNAAPRVATAIVEALDDGSITRARHAVWPRSLRVSRALHAWGLRALLELGERAPQFFDAFFELPAEQWMAYLRVDAPPQQIARTMAAVFGSVPWSVRRSLLLLPG